MRLEDRLATKVQYYNYDVMTLRTYLILTLNFTVMVVW